jgi:hypothetical protein
MRQDLEDYSIGVKIKIFVTVKLLVEYKKSKKNASYILLKYQRSYYMQILNK